MQITEIPLFLNNNTRTKVFISLAQPDDLPQVVEIYNQSIASKKATADLKTISIAEKQVWFDAHLSNAKRPIYVVKTASNEMVAWGSFSDLKSRAAYHISSEISIYVNNQFQRMGIADSLLTWMIEQAPTLGIINIVALIFAHNTPSIDLFTKHGFKQWGLMPNICDMDGFTADVITLGKVV